MTTFDRSNPLLQPVGAQLSMHGHDWTSDADRKAQARAEKRRVKAALACAKKLEAAADAVNEFLAACNECRDGSGQELHGSADGRIRLISDMMEYSGYLESKFGKEVQS